MAMAPVALPTPMLGRSCRPGFFRPLKPSPRPIQKLHKPKQWHVHPLRAYSVQQSPSPSPTPDPTQGPEEDDPPATQSAFRRKYGPTLFKMFESAATTFASIAILGLVGYSYTLYYKKHVLQKIAHAFEPGDPILELAAIGKNSPSATAKASAQIHWIEREEQGKIDAIVNGTEHGRYYLLVGEKGTGKASMLIEAMQKTNGEGVSMFDCHADMEIFRIRLGKALDFEYHEDNIGALFSIRGPRDASALLDIERAFNKLEKVALRRRKEKGRPLVLIINNMHLLRDDEDGRDLLELLQQRAEQWAAANLCNMVFNSDDYWIYERMKVQGTRLEMIPVKDLPKDKAISALTSYRRDYFGEIPDRGLLETVYDRVGGRLTFLNKVAKSPNMLKVCEEICIREKTWFLNQCGILGEEMDDDVMDQQKYASAAMVLAKALVDKETEMESTYDPTTGYILPSLPLHQARQVMTRADFIQSYDQINVFTIDSVAKVRADSVPMMHAFREICSQDGFDKYLEATLTRIGDIESLGRTREVTLKDLWEGKKYLVDTFDAKGRQTGTVKFANEPQEEEQDDGFDPRKVDAA